ncbi:MAG: DsrE family protein [Methanoregulaceae archaeon]|nr:DsrE family protein [Methanoregulaceae archaeon]
MTPNPFLLGDALTTERLTWIAGSLKFYFVSLHPDALRQAPEGKPPYFIFFLTGDALYSLVDRENLPIWEIILGLPQVWIVCDREELDLRGLSVDSLKMKYPGQIFDQNGRQSSYPRSFWREIIRIGRQLEPASLTIGYMLTKSPYMYGSCRNAVDCLHAATEEQLSPELYAYLDGVHALHVNQKPAEFRNIGQGFLDLHEISRKKDLNFKVIACERCATARGYATWDDGHGMIVSNCTIEPSRIRNLSEIIERFKAGHPIFGESSAMIDIRPPGSSHGQRLHKDRSPPPVILLVTRTPYSTEDTFGGLSFAIACAYGKIPARIVFIEDGIYCLTGMHHQETADMIFSMQEVIDTAAGIDQIELYAYQPSFQHRGVTMSRDIKGVLEITAKDLGKLLFSPQKGTLSNHQRILFV